MIRLRACIPALFALLIPLASQAAAIKVTTPFDEIKADDLCSLREAYLTTVRANDLNGRSSAKKTIELQHTDLQEELANIIPDPDLVTYPVAKMSANLQEIEDELNAIDDLLEAEPLPASDPRRQEIATLLADLVLYRDNKLGWLNLGLPHERVQSMEAAIALHERTIEVITKEYDRLLEFDRVDGCSEGTFFDTILLSDDTTYYLGTPLVVGYRIALKGGKNTIITRCREALQCPAANPATAARLMVLNSNAEISSLTFLAGGIGWSAGGTVIAIEGGGGGAIQVNSAATFNNVTFRGNRAQDGGAIYVGNTATLTLDKTWFYGNEAVNDGGAIAVEGAGINVTRSVFGRNKGTCHVTTGLLGQTFAEIDDAGGNDRNCAGRHGGAVATNRVDGRPSVVLDSIGFIGNESVQDGSALFTGDERATIYIKNVTIAHNVAGGSGAVHVSPSLDGTLSINNVTLVENEAATGTGGIYVDVDVILSLYNSVIAGNQGVANPDCDFNGLTDGALPAISPSSFRRNMYANGSSCPGKRYLTTVPSAPEEENFELASGMFLIGRLPTDPEYNGAADGPIDQSLMVPDTSGEFYIPVYPDNVLDVAENRLVNRGAGSLDEAGCAAEDQRGLLRQSSIDASCDIGAVEYQVGHREDDFFETLVNERKCLDVGDNDAGDSTYVRYSLRVLGVERGRGTAVIASDNVMQFTTLNPGVPVVDISQCPNAAEFIDTSPSAPPGTYKVHEVVLFTPTPGFHGEIAVTYQLDWQTRPTGGAPLQDRVTGIAVVSTDVASGLASESLKGGALLPALLAVVGLLGLRRRRPSVREWAGRMAMLAGCLVLAPLAHADNIIYVNSGLDEPLQQTAGDGKCTLREALIVARNDRANPTGGDCLNGNEGPDIIEFMPNFVDAAPGQAGHPVVQLEDQVESYGGVTLRCPDPVEYLGKGFAIAPVVGYTDRAHVTVGFLHNLKQNDRVVLEFGTQTSLNRPDGYTILGIDGAGFTIRTEPGPVPVADVVDVKPVPVCTIRRNPAATNAFRLIDSRGSLVVRNLILEGGRASTTGVRSEGGAIYSTGNLSISGSIFRDNRAVSGGAIFLGGDSASITVQGSLFTGNSSLDGQNWNTASQVGTGRGGGGAIATSRDSPHKIQVVSTTFAGNRSFAGAAALDLNSRAATVVANSTFVGNYSYYGSGALDVSGVSALSTLRNITVVGNLSGAAPFLDGWETELSVVPVPPVQRVAVQLGVSSALLTSSIVSSNYVYDPLVHGDPYPAAAPDPLQFASTPAANCFFSTRASQEYNLFGDLPAPPATQACSTGNQVIITNAVDVWDITGQRTDLSPQADPATLTDTLLTGLIDSAVPLPEGSLPLVALNSKPLAATVMVAWMKDSGFVDTTSNADSYADPFSQGTLRCASVDQRGVSRTAGGRCDRGAYELLQVTAAADSESNIGRADRLVVVDLLSNDFFDDITALPENRFKTDCSHVVVSGIVGGERTVSWRDDAGDTCIEVKDDVTNGDDLNPGADIASGGRGRIEFLTPSAAGADSISPYVIRFDNRGIVRLEKLSGDPLVDEVAPMYFGLIGLQYRVFTRSQEASAWARLTLTIDNVPPTAVADVIHASPGDVVTIDVLANDYDRDQQAGTTVEITDVSDGGCTVIRTDLIGGRQVSVEWQCAYGKLYFDPLAKRFTFIPDNSFNAFSQTFSYSITDNDPVVPKTARAKADIIVVRPSANAGSLLGEKDLSDMLGIDWLGAPAPVFGLALLGALLRRRRH